MFDTIKSPSVYGFIGLHRGCSDVDTQAVTGVKQDVDGMDVDNMGVGIVEEPEEIDEQTGIEFGALSSSYHQRHMRWLEVDEDAD